MLYLLLLNLILPEGMTNIVYTTTQSESDSEMVIEPVLTISDSHHRRTLWMSRSEPRILPVSQSQAHATETPTLLLRAARNLNKPAAKGARELSIY